MARTKKVSVTRKRSRSRTAPKAKQAKQIRTIRSKVKGATVAKSNKKSTGSNRVTVSVNGKIVHKS